jgi:O-methyltransferase involved in polyketide biosynthesis
MSKLKMKNIHLSNIQETLVLPLWARAKDFDEEHSVLNDKKANVIFQDFHYDYSEIEKDYGLMQKIAMSVRSKNLDDAIKCFMEDHPKASVVSIGSGLGTAFYRVDNGQIKWYDLDLPDVIEIRKQLIPEIERVKYIAKSVFDYTWFDEIEYCKDGIIFVANGVLMYFEENQLRSLFSALATKFPGSEIVFDAHSKIAITVGNKINLERYGINARMKWSIRRAKKIKHWDERIEIIDEYSMYERTPRESSWGDDIIEKMEIVDNRKLANIFHLSFKLNISNQKSR